MVLVARYEVMIHEGAKENISVKYISMDETAGQASRSYKSPLKNSVLCSGNRKRPIKFGRSPIKLLIVVKSENHFITYYIKLFFF
jgi:hypothetical protein